MFLSQIICISVFILRYAHLPQQLLPLLALFLLFLLYHMLYKVILVVILDLLDIFVPFVFGLLPSLYDVI